MTISREELGNRMRIGGFEVPDLSIEPKQRNWYSVILGAGVFTVRAFSEDYALFKAEIRAGELRASCVALDTNGGLPLVLQATYKEKTYREKVWFDGKIEADLTNFTEQDAVLFEIPNDDTSIKSAYNPDQTKLFDTNRM